ncbi:MAG: TetR/AcrR family transcriptional regulator [Haloechinothrix sp.]
MSSDRSYHHGDLRRALLTAAVEVIAEHGPAYVSLRELARRAGVTHAAPAHHFTDKAGLLTALAVQGNDMLADSLEDALAVTPIDLTELGVRYVRFAAEFPAHFEVMYRPDLYHRDDPELVAARTRTGEVLRIGVAAMGSRTGGDPELAGLAAWMMAHGFAALRQSGNLDAAVGDRDPEDVFRAAAGLMFGVSDAG